MRKAHLFLLTLLLTLTGALGASAQTKEAYYTVNYDEIDSRYIFYYDNKRGQRSNTYSLTENGNKLILWLGNDTRIKFDSSFADYRPKNTSHWFEDVVSGTVIFEGMEYLNTSEVTNMSYMFKGLCGE